jgi:hypothetical protein
MPTVDKYSIATLPLDQMAGSDWLGNATGFLWETEGKYHLITNWHVVTGRSPAADDAASRPRAPNHLKILWFAKTAGGPDSTSVRKSTEEPLRDADGRPRWLIHPKHGKDIDVVALPLEIAQDIQPYPINQLPSDDLAFDIGMDVFVIGYPYTLGSDGLPVWKRASVASEPDMFVENQKHILIDSASRPGMSGAPVIRRSYGSHHMRDGTSNMGQKIRTKFVGVYSGRVTARDPLDAQLGMMWPAEFVPEIITGNRRDT